MTIQNTADFEGYDDGLDDFGMEDMVIPRLSIVHKEGQFKDSLSNEQFSKMNVIILGLVKQRVLWHTTLDDGDWPMCRSANFVTGIPNVSDEQPREKRFPWDKSGFRPDDFPPDENGTIRLGCAGCQLKEWGSHPDGKKPYCSEQFTLPIMYDPRGDESWVPALVTFQKTALKPLKSYLSSFKRSRTAAFSAITEISLDMLKKGSTDYSVPTFKRVGDTDDKDWREYSVNFRSMRDFLVAEPGSRDEDEGASPQAPVESAPANDPWATPKESEPVDAEIVEEGKDAPPQAPAQSAPATESSAPAAPAPQAASTPPVASGDEDDLPF